MSDNDENGTKPDPPLGEAAVLSELLEWLKERPLWLQEAARRLLLRDTLNGADLDDLTALCCLTDDLPEVEPISDGDIASVSASGAVIALTGLSNLRNINALADEQTLSFSPKGMTVVYGDNGSGKSGYVRVLKHACRTRGKIPGILPDIADLGSKVEQSARIGFVKAGVKIEYEWSPNAPPNSDLHNVSIFDSRSAIGHVEIENALAYSPTPMTLLSKLGDACEVVTAQIEAKITELSGQTPQALLDPSTHQGTEVTAFLQTLGPKSNPNTFRKLCTLSADEHDEHRSLQADLAQEPKIVAARLRSQIDRLTSLVNEAEQFVSASDDASLDELKYAEEAQAKAHELAEVAAKQLFDASPLPNVGESLWQQLWEAARAYSNQQANPDRVFPDFRAEADVCVLCQQPLTDTAVKRFVTFEDFIKSDAKAKEQRATAARNQKRSMLSACVMPLARIRDFVRVISDELVCPIQAGAVRKSLLVARRRVQMTLRGWGNRPDFVAFPSADLATVVSNLQARRSQLMADDASPERAALVKRYEELSDRIKFAPFISDLELEIERRKKTADLQNAKKDARKRPVTDKNKELSDRLVTNKMRGRFMREIQALKIGSMPIELKKIRDSSAVSYFQVVLVDYPKAPIGDILSEGEYRCVALAGFLAELATAHDQSPILFDDPMSSLDHIHRDQVAKRLVEESKCRQVIIFTHDLTFLWALRREAEIQDCQDGISFQHVMVRSNKPGFIEADLPLKGKNALASTAALKAKLKQNKGRFNQWDDTDRKIWCAGFIEQLREAWDQGIADFIHPVLARFDNHIRPGSLSKLTALSNDDIAIVDAAHARLSNDLHHKSEAINPSEVTAEQLLKEIKALEDWLTDISRRQKAVPTRSDRNRT